MEKILFVEPKECPLAELVTEGPIPETFKNWMEEDFEPFTQDTLNDILRQLEEIENT